LARVEGEKAFHQGHAKTTTPLTAAPTASAAVAAVVEAHAERWVVGSRDDGAQLRRVANLMGRDFDVVVVVLMLLWLRLLWMLLLFDNSYMNWSPCSIQKK